MVENRMSERISIRLEAVFYIDLMVSSGIVSDLSEGGLRLNCECSLEKNQLVDFEVVPEPGELPIVARGRVVWA